MSKIAMLSLFLSFAMPAAYADNHDKASCSCTKECKENCQKGKSEDCKCKECDCKNSTHCHK